MDESSDVLGQFHLGGGGAIGKTDQLFNMINIAENIYLTCTLFLTRGTI